MEMLQWSDGDIKEGKIIIPNQSSSRHMPSIGSVQERVLNSKGGEKVHSLCAWSETTGRYHLDPPDSKSSQNRDLCIP